jgi:hypothetical protein
MFSAERPCVKKFIISFQHFLLYRANSEKMGGEFGLGKRGKQASSNQTNTQLQIPFDCCHAGRQVFFNPEFPTLPIPNAALAT